jgi:hypothetical protein
MILVNTSNKWMMNNEHNIYIGVEAWYGRIGYNPDYWGMYNSSTYGDLLLNVKAGALDAGVH